MKALWALIHAIDRLAAAMEYSNAQSDVHQAETIRAIARTQQSSEQLVGIALSRAGHDETGRPQ